MTEAERDLDEEEAYEELAEALWHLQEERQTRLLEAIHRFVEAHVNALERRLKAEREAAK